MENLGSALLLGTPYIKGSENVVADCLSRAEANAIFSDVGDIDFIEIEGTKQ